MAKEFSIEESLKYLDQRGWPVYQEDEGFVINLDGDGVYFPWNSLEHLSWDSEAVLIQWVRRCFLTRGKLLTSAPKVSWDTRERERQQWSSRVADFSRSWGKKGANFRAYADTEFEAVLKSAVSYEKNEEKLKEKLSRSDGNW